MKLLVVDASVVIKWTLPEADSERALALHDAHLEQKWNLLKIQWGGIQTSKV